jgi:hypothetical protein
MWTDEKPDMKDPYGQTFGSSPVSSCVTPLAVAIGAPPASW